MVLMFNTLFEHECLLNKQGRPPTGRLSEAFKESLGGGLFTPSYLCVRAKRPLEPLLHDFPLPGENDDY